LVSVVSPQLMRIARSPRWALRSDLIDPAIDVHRGRVVKRTGDGLLAEFRSVVDAVRCAIELQHGAIERNAGAG
jgi:adenylate cyclase